MTLSAANGKLVLVHLSDIHFGRPGMNGPYDLDLPLRNEIERDLRSTVQVAGPARGILISGDIAFSGQAAQYQMASEWLKGVSQIIGCGDSDVWVVPGNHDVDRSVISGSKTLTDWHALVRGKGAGRVDAELQGAAGDAPMAEAVLRAMRHYNEFATKFNCSISLDQPYWEYDLTLNDGSKLRLRGLTSTFISDRNDNSGDNKLALGSFQADLRREDGVEYLTICHHPPQWLLDEDAVDQRLKALARVQLFGHKHIQVLDRINDGLRLTAGAVHPDRGELAWLPRYNLLSLLVVEHDGRRLLRVEVWPRVWNAESQSFVPHRGNSTADCRRFDLQLPAWETATSKSAAEPREVVSAKDSKGMAKPKVAIEVKSGIDHGRVLVYQFLTLPMHQRVEICHELDLLPRNADQPIDNPFFEVAFRLAREQRLLARVWKAVESKRGSVGGENPFDGE